MGRRLAASLLTDMVGYYFGNRRTECSKSQKPSDWVGSASTGQLQPSL